MQSRIRAFALVTASLLLLGCGGTLSTSPVHAQSGFTDATVKGNYAASLSGVQPINTGQLTEFDILANLVSDGAGHFSGNYSEFIQYTNNVSGTTNSTGACTGTITGGTYTINSNGNGQANLTFVPSSQQSCLMLAAQFALSTTSTGSEIVFAEMDGTASGAGTGVLQ